MNKGITLNHQVQFMVKVKLPSSCGFHCSPSGDMEYEQAIHNTIIAAKHPDFEVHWPKLNEKWPIDSQGYTYVPLYLRNNQGSDQMNNWINMYYDAQKEIKFLKEKIKDLAGFAR